MHDGVRWKPKTRGQLKIDLNVTGRGSIEDLDNDCDIARVKTKVMGELAFWGTSSFQISFLSCSVFCCGVGVGHASR